MVERRETTVGSVRSENRNGPSKVYIGRPSKWGNPFVIGPDGNRKEVIEKYRTWVMNKPELVIAARKELKGKRLMCWCAPLACHGDVLAELADEGGTD